MNSDHYPTIPATGRRSHPGRSPYANDQPLSMNDKTLPLRAALAIADEHPDSAGARIFTSRQVKRRGQPFPVKGKNKAQRARLQAGFTASRCKVFTKLPERLL